MTQTRNGYVKTKDKIDISIDTGVLDITKDLAKQLDVSVSAVIQQALIDKIEEVRGYEDE